MSAVRQSNVAINKIKNQLVNDYHFNVVDYNEANKYYVLDNFYRKSGKHTVYLAKDNFIMQLCPASDRYIAFSTNEEKNANHFIIDSVNDSDFSLFANGSCYVLTLNDFIGKYMLAKAREIKSFKL